MSKADSHPNLLFITADQLRHDSLGCYGHPLVQSPNLDALAARGVRFANHFNQATPCGPSRNSIHTGMYLMNHRGVTNGTPLARRFTNWAAELRRQTGGKIQPKLIGYTDAPTDPRGLPLDHPQLQHWDGGYLEGFENLTEHDNDLGSAAWLSSQGFPQDVVDKAAELEANGKVSWNGWRGDMSPWLAPAAPGYEAGTPTADGHAPPAVYTAEQSDTYIMCNRAIDYIESQSTETTPWAVHLSLLKPHPPLIAPAPYNEMYPLASVSLPTHRAPSAEEEGAAHPFLANTVRSMSEEQLRESRASYYGLITECDANLGRVFESLEQSGQFENTIIVFSTDHGEQLGDHHLMNKLGFFDQSYHIPCIIADPRPCADTTRGTVVEAFTEHVDLMPTILRAVLGDAAEIPRQCDGHSLLPFLEGNPPSFWRSHVCWEYDFRWSEFGQREVLVDQTAAPISLDALSLSVFRDATHKYVHFGASSSLLVPLQPDGLAQPQIDALPPLLFDLKAEKGAELVNLAQDPRCAMLTLEYAQKMLSWRMQNADRTLTHLIIGDRGVYQRTIRGPAHALAQPLALEPSLPVARL